MSRKNSIRGGTGTTLPCKNIIQNRFLDKKKRGRGLLVEYVVYLMPYTGATCL
jgi:hypothetical protein